MDQSGRNCITWWGLITELATSSHERLEGLDMLNVSGEITSQNLYTQLTYSSCYAVCIVTMNSEEDDGEDGCWVGYWQYLPWLTLVE